MLSGNKDYCLTFWYYVYGSPASAVLRAYIGREQAYSRPEWSRQHPVEGQWTQAEVSVHHHSPLQVIFAAELGNGFSGVALDDVSIIEGDCSGGAERIKKINHTRSNNQL